MEPLPGRLITGRLCLELVATVRGRFDVSPRDHIADGRRLTSWLTALGISLAEPPGDPDAGQFRRLREAIFRLVTTVTTGNTDLPTAADLTLLNDHADTTVPVPHATAVLGGDGLVFIAESAPLSAVQVLAVLARDAIELLTGPAARLLHQCEADPCGAFFVDASRGTRRRWCLSSTCGNRVRVGAYRDRMTNSREPA